MSNDENNKFLGIAFYALHSEWIYRIRKVLDDEQLERYKGTPLAEFARSISRKLSLLRMYVDNVNLEMTPVNEILKKDIEKIELIIKKKQVYHFENIHHIYSLLGNMESFIITMKSILELIEKYIVKLFKEVLEIKFRNPWEYLKRNGLNIEWKEDIVDKIRNDIIHNYASWIGFKKKDNNFIPVMALPESFKKFKNFKKFREDYLDTDDINKIINEFFEFFDKTIELLIKEIKKHSQ